MSEKGVLIPRKNKQFGYFQRFEPTEATGSPLAIQEKVILELWEFIQNQKSLNPEFSEALEELTMKSGSDKPAKERFK